MAVTVESLKTRFPEFDATPETLVAACIADAELMLSSEAFGNQYDMAVNYKAAHLIAVNPLGEMARLDAKKPASNGSLTVYERSFLEIKKGIGVGGFMVI